MFITLVKIFITHIARGECEGMFVRLSVHVRNSKPIALIDFILLHKEECAVALLLRWSGSR